MPSKPTTKPKPANAPSKRAAAAAPEPSEAEELEQVRQEANGLENLLEAELLRDAVLTARMALDELRTESRGAPYERRRGIRLREKAVKVERAFNRLRALRLGLLLPITEDS